MSRRDPFMSVAETLEFQHEPQRKADEELADWQRATLGQYARLEIPLTHSRDLRRFADVIRGIANQPDVLSRDTQNSEFVILSRARREIVAHANLKLKEMTKRRVG